MIPNSKSSTNNSNHNTCPHLGLSDDPKTFSAYPSEWNVCHHVSPIITPSFDQQQNYCLQDAYTNCPIFIAPSGQKMPKEFQSHKSSLSISKKTRLRITMISIVVLLVVLVLIFSSLSGGEIFGFLSQDMNTPHRTDTRVSQDTSQTSQMTTSQENIIEEIAKTQTDPPPSPTKQLTSTPTDVKPVLTLDIPIGSEYQFIIHRVKEGESLQIFADLYNTSVEAIRAVNYDLIAPLWIDWLVIIPVNTTDVEDIPTFEPYQVESDQITISELSKQLSTQLEDLLLYNNLDSEHVLYQGEWLLIPRERSEP